MKKQVVAALLGITITSLTMTGGCGGCNNNDALADKEDITITENDKDKSDKNGTGKIEDDEKNTGNDKNTDGDKNTGGDKETSGDKNTGDDKNNGASNNGGSNIGGGNNNNSNGGSNTGGGNNNNNNGGSNGNSGTNAGGSNTGNGGSSSGVATGNAGGQAHTCNHNWVEQFKTVPHEEEWHYETKIVVDQEAWDEPVYEFREVTRCSTCKEDIGGHAVDHIMNTGHAGYYSQGENVLIDTIYHEAVTHTEQVKVVDKAAWDEKVSTGYKCSICGEIK